MVQKNYGTPYVRVVYFVKNDILTESGEHEGDAFLADIFFD